MAPFRFRPQTLNKADAQAFAHKALSWSYFNVSVKQAIKACLINLGDERNTTRKRQNYLDGTFDFLDALAGLLELEVRIFSYKNASRTLFFTPPAGEPNFRTIRTHLWAEILCTGTENHRPVFIPSVQVLQYL